MRREAARVIGRLARVGQSPLRTKMAPGWGPGAGLRNGRPWMVV
jgi:hypothetical protein